MAAPNQSHQSLHCVLMPTTADPALMPYAAVAEILEIDPDGIEGEARGIQLGELAWRGRRVPVTSLEQACGRAAAAPPGKQVIAVLYNPGDERVPYLALRLADAPRSQAVHETNLPSTSDPLGCEYVQAAALLNGRKVVIPDVPALARECG